MGKAERQSQICGGLIDKGLAPNIVLGIGSYSYQMATRDTFGHAMKATWGVVNGQPRDIFKDPKTDRGSEKKSAKGLLQVYRDELGELRLLDQCSKEQESTGLLKDVFVDGKIVSESSLADIRKKLHGDSF